MSYLLDLLVVGILALCIWNGKRKGFIKTFFGFFGSLIAYFLASLFALPVGNLIGDAIYPSMKDKFIASVAARAGASAENLDATQLPEACNEILHPFGYDAESLSDFASAEGVGTLEGVAESIVRPVADSVGFAIAAVLLFIVFLVLIRILVHCLDLLAKLPGLKFSNKVLGSVAGGLHGAFLVILLSSAWMLIYPGISEESFFAQLDPDHTILFKLFGAIDLIGVVF